MSVLHQVICRVDVYGVKNYRTGFMAAMALGILYAVIGIMAHFLLHFELQMDGANITNYEDAFWTLQMSASTIGFGDHYPISTGGRWVVSMMFYIGVGLVGFVGALVADKIVGFSNTGVKNRELRKQNAEILEHVRALSQQVDAISKGVKNHDAN